MACKLDFSHDVLFLFPILSGTIHNPSIMQHLGDGDQTFYELQVHTARVVLDFSWGGRHHICAPPACSKALVLACSKGRVLAGSRV